MKSLSRPSAPAHLALVLFVVALSSGCRGARIRQLERRVDQLESRVSNLEGRVGATSPQPAR
jgi:outer membrane murein-binding lipoprotein Lpp